MKKLLAVLFFAALGVALAELKHRSAEPHGKIEFYATTIEDSGYPEAPRITHFTVGRYPAIIARGVQLWGKQVYIRVFQQNDGGLVSQTTPERVPIKLYARWAIRIEQAGLYRVELFDEKGPIKVDPIFIEVDRY